MIEAPYTVGYGRPPEHTRFQKGRSGNPGGKPKPKTPAQQAFDAVVADALDADTRSLKDSRPAKLIEAFVRRVALDAAEGRPSAQRLLLSLIDRDGQRPADTGPAGPATIPSAEERTRALLGERYDAFKSRFEKAIETGSGDELLALTRELDAPENSLSQGIPEGISAKVGG